MFGGQGADVATSLLALRNPQLEERNPLGTKGVMIGKAALVGLSSYFMHKLHESGHDTAAKLMGLGAGIGGAIPALHNISEMNKYGSK